MVPRTQREVIDFFAPPPDGFLLGGNDQEVLARRALPAARAERICRTLHAERTLTRFGRYGSSGIA
jgi:hypothetical protein